MTRLLTRFAAAVAMAAVAGCATDPYELASEDREYGWRHRAYAELLVAGVYADLQLRQGAEIAFAYELARKDVTVTRSLETRRDVLAEIANDPSARAGTDAMLTVTTVPVAAARRLQGALDREGIAYLVELERGDRAARGPTGVYAKPGAYLLHVALWDLESGKPVWQATTDSYSDVPAENQINALAIDIVGTLRQRGLI